MLPQRVLEHCFANRIPHLGVEAGFPQERHVHPLDR